MAANLMVASGLISSCAGGLTIAGLTTGSKVHTIRRTRITLVSTANQIITAYWRRTDGSTPGTSTSVNPTILQGVAAADGTWGHNFTVEPTVYATTSPVDYQARSSLGPGWVAAPDLTDELQVAASTFAGLYLETIAPVDLIWSVLYVQAA